LEIDCTVRHKTQVEGLGEVGVNENYGGGEAATKIP
jgi:hypothetical protein